MKAHIEIVYKDGTTKAVVIEKKIRVKGVRFLNAIDAAVNKRTDLGDWDRWNLVSIED